MSMSIKMTAFWFLFISAFVDGARARRLKERMPKSPTCPDTLHASVGGLDGSLDWSVKLDSVVNPNQWMEPTRCPAVSGDYSQDQLDHRKSLAGAIPGSYFSALCRCSAESCEWVIDSYAHCYTEHLQMLLWQAAALLKWVYWGTFRDVSENIREVVLWYRALALSATTLNPPHRDCGIAKYVWQVIDRVADAVVSQDHDVDVTFTGQLDFAVGKISEALVNHRSDFKEIIAGLQCDAKPPPKSGEWTTDSDYTAPRKMERGFAAPGWGTDPIAVEWSETHISVPAWRTELKMALAADTYPSGGVILGADGYDVKPGTKAIQATFDLDHPENSAVNADVTLEEGFIAEPQHLELEQYMLDDLKMPSEDSVQRWIGKESSSLTGYILVKFQHTDAGFTLTYVHRDDIVIAASHNLLVEDQRELSEDLEARGLKVQLLHAPRIDGTCDYGKDTAQRHRADWVRDYSAIFQSPVPGSGKLNSTMVSQDRQQGSKGLLYDVHAMMEGRFEEGVVKELKLREEPPAMEIQGGNLLGTGTGVCVSSTTLLETNCRGKARNTWRAATIQGPFDDAALRSKTVRRMKELGCHTWVFLEGPLEDGTGHVDIMLAQLKDDHFAMGYYDVRDDPFNSLVLSESRKIFKYWGWVLGYHVHELRMPPVVSTELAERHGESALQLPLSCWPLDVSDASLAPCSDHKDHILFHPAAHAYDGSEHAKDLQNFVDEVWDTPKTIRTYANMLPVIYSNSYCTEQFSKEQCGVVFVPSYEYAGAAEKEEAVVAFYKQYFDEVKLIGQKDRIRNMGSIHCITRQVPSDVEMTSTPADIEEDILATWLVA